MVAGVESALVAMFCSSARLAEVRRALAEEQALPLGFDA
jgi:hypothetical protein